MNPFLRLYDWLDIRSQEGKLLWLSCAGAFLVVGYMVLARSLREALYLDAFDVKTLPYITASVVVLGFFAAGIFSRFLAKFRAQSVLKFAILLTIAGLGVLWPIAGIHYVTIILFYLWTAVATICLTAGFWIVVAEHFPLRGAKRLYGLVSAGGTAGAMVIGTSLKPLTEKIPIWGLIPAVIGLLALFLLVIILLPRQEEFKQAKAQEKVTLREEVSLVWNSKYLFTIATIVVTATLASQLLDFQFKELVKINLKEKVAMAGFFGGFYGWTGAAALFVQVFIASRLMTKSGIAWTLAVLPFILLAGGVGLLLFPSFILVTAVRGTDNSLRKSLHRSVLEVTYLPLTSMVRRKTKTFIDSVLDAAAEGAAALIIFLLVTLGDLPSRILTFFVIAFAAIFLFQTRRMGKEYYEKLVERLKEKGEKGAEQEEEEEEEPEEISGYGQDLIDASFSSIDLQESLKKRGIVFQSSRRPGREVPPPTPVRAEAPPGQSATFDDPNDEKILGTLKSGGPWQSRDVPGLTRLLARDALYGPATKVLGGIEDQSLDHLVSCLLDENCDFMLRRRIPKVLSKMKSSKVEEALLKALKIERFEIRYRAAIALMKRREAELLNLSEEERKRFIWEAIDFEVNHERPVWEMQQVLDNLDEDEQDTLAIRRLEVRGELSLEHVFRMLALVADPKVVRAAFRALQTDNGKTKSFALEYLEHVLPNEIQKKLWPFIGDVSEYQKKRAIRPLEEIAHELVKSGETLFADPKTKKEILKTIENIKEENEQEPKK